MMTGKFDRLRIKHTYTSATMPGRDTMQFTDHKLIIGAFTDYILTVPAVNRVWRIKQLYLHNDGTKESSNCTGGMSYMLNDSMYVIGMIMDARDQPALINIVK